PRDPNFAQTVVWLIQHGAPGAFGVVVNRPVKAPGLPVPVFRGGPCESQGLLMLHGHEDWIEASELAEREVVPGIFLGDAHALKRITDPAPNQTLRFRLFAGNAGWGPGQLESEVAAGAWAAMAATADCLFDPPPDDLWQQLL